MSRTPLSATETLTAHHCALTTSEIRLNFSQPFTLSPFFPFLTWTVGLKPGRRWWIINVWVLVCWSADAYDFMSGAFSPSNVILTVLLFQIFISTCWVDRKTKNKSMCMKAHHQNITYHRHHFWSWLNQFSHYGAAGVVLAIVFQPLTLELFLILQPASEWLRAKRLLSTSEQAGFRPNGVSWIFYYIVT